MGDKNRFESGEIERRLADVKLGKLRGRARFAPSGLRNLLSTSQFHLLLNCVLSIVATCDTCLQNGNSARETRAGKVGASVCAQHSAVRIMHCRFADKSW